MGTNWKKLIEEEFNDTGDKWDDVVFCTLNDEELIKEFDDSYGLTEVKAFTLWTNDRVYFSAIYDGLEWVEWVYRNPTDEPTYHVG